MRISVTDAKGQLTELVRLVSEAVAFLTLNGYALGGLAQRVRAERGPMTGSGVIHHILSSNCACNGGLRIQ
jgi:hypothetical protein